MSARDAALESVGNPAGAGDFLLISGDAGRRNPETADPVGENRRESLILAAHAPITPRFTS
jgi:hypothetical protein